MMKLRSRAAGAALATALAACLAAPAIALATGAPVTYEDDEVWYDSTHDVYVGEDLVDVIVADDSGTVYDFENGILLNPNSTSDAWYFTVDSTQPTAASTRAAMSAVEMLGLASVEEQGSFSTIVDTGSYYQPVFSWAQPKYMFFATRMADAHSPYLVNFAYHTGSNMAVYNPSREGGGAGPNAILAQANADATDDAVWAMSPDVIIGDGGKNSITLSTWHNGYDEYNYVKYDVHDYPAMVQTAEDIYDAVVYRTTQPGKSSLNTTDVGNNVAAFADYVDYMHNSATGTTVALVLDYDSNTQLYEIGSSHASAGTAPINRYLEAALWGGATNINTNTTSASIYVDDSTLAGVDLLIVGGQQSWNNYTPVMQQLWDDTLLDNAYFVENNQMGVGAPYGYLMNSFDNAQNLARILPIINGDTQYDDVAYFIENFYHIDHDYVDDVISYTIDGNVRNWDHMPSYVDINADIAYMTAW